MQDLLAQAVRAHGGAEHWRTLSRLRARARVQGAIWAVKGKGASSTTSPSPERRAINA